MCKNPAPVDSEPLATASGEEMQVADGMDQNVFDYGPIFDSRNYNAIEPMVLLFWFMCNDHFRQFCSLDAYFLGVYAFSHSFS